MIGAAIHMWGLLIATVTLMKVYVVRSRCQIGYKELDTIFLSPQNKTKTNYETEHKNSQKWREAVRGSDWSLNLALHPGSLSVVKVL